MKEDQIQKHVASHFQQLAAYYKTFTFFAVPNGGKREEREAAKLKASGVRAGVHDLIFLFPGGVLFVELKTKDGVLSDSQKDFHATIELFKHKGITVYAEHGHDAIDQITRHIENFGFKLK